MNFTDTFIHRIPQHFVPLVLIPTYKHNLPHLFMFWERHLLPWQPENQRKIRPLDGWNGHSLFTARSTGQFVRWHKQFLLPTNTNKFKISWEQREAIHPEAKGGEVNRWVCRRPLKGPFSATGENWRHVRPTLAGKIEIYHNVIIAVSQHRFLCSRNTALTEAQTQGERRVCCLCLEYQGRRPSWNDGGRTENHVSSTFTEAMCWEFCAAWWES